MYLSHPLILSVALLIVQMENFRNGNLYLPYESSIDSNTPPTHVFVQVFRIGENSRISSTGDFMSPNVL